MSMMLTFTDALWVSARTYAQTGQRTQALAALQPLLQNEQARPDLRVLAFRLAARLEMQVARHQPARRLLRSALRIHERYSEAHYELGLAWHCDPLGCEERAARCFQRALKQNPTKALYRAALGRSLVNLGEIGRGVKQLLRAIHEVPNNLDILAIVVEGLIQARRYDRAVRIVQQAEFRDRGNPKLRQLREQIRYAKATKRREPVNVEADSTILSFPNVVDAKPRLRIRVDAGSRSQPHLTRLRAYRAER